MHEVICVGHPSYIYFLRAHSISMRTINGLEHFLFYWAKVLKPSSAVHETHPAMPTSQDNEMPTTIRHTLFSIYHLLNDNTLTGILDSALYLHLAHNPRIQNPSSKISK
jgi:hypothetical protein